MTSEINTSGIDVAFPVAGVSNDTKGFRDNFLSIKANLDKAATEITALQTDVVGNGYTGSAGPSGPSGGYTGSASTVRGYTGSVAVGFTGSVGAGYTGSASTAAGYAGSTGAGYTGSASTAAGYAGSAGVLSGTRTTASVTTTSIANGATNNPNITGYKTYLLYKITTSAACWVRLYTTTATRTADASRLQTVDPSPNSGVIAEVITTGAETIVVSPAAIGFNNETSPTTSIPIAVTNLSGATRTITVTLTLMQME